MRTGAGLRQEAETLAGPLPPLLAAAEHLAASVLTGEHGRRRTGQGDQFWQYRPSHAGDEARMIDWRRSARADDALFVREKEWQAAQSVALWLDAGQSMEFSSAKDIATKADTARRLALALSVLLVRGGERVGLTNAGLPPRTGQVQLLRLTDALASPAEADEYEAPELRGIPARSRAVFFSDFMGDLAPVERALTRAADRGISGALCQVLDPQEEAFPFDGRTIFQSIGGTMVHETLKAGDLRGRYLERLAARKDALSRLARNTGWQYLCYHTDRPASGALLWLYGALERVH
ncbi:DUF58 domain-containing protein [Alphaproteobacteria bacterium GH1-50]|uniref:DUF58 domain-containing protein n=1 Tax=Kangsaoukella pontilimi TaxID=2691042 RepID=A0A7C9MY13_9RHOB|nr:DUF58 domain-containing protein [Kangsaoukella pontilimi]MXQ08774.1 DUF58 domain-containing protein [Kangsaoukella pontilimi]